MTPDHELLLTTATVEITAAEAHRPPRVEIVAYSGDVMTVPQFGPIVVDLRGMELPAEVPLLADHDNSIRAIVGQGTPTVRDGKLIVSGTANTTTEAAKQIVELGKSGHRFQASIGATPLESRRVATGETIQTNGRTIKAASPILFVTRSKLREVTICALGCDAGTSVSIAAKKDLSMTTATTDQDILAAERERVSTIEAAFDGLELLALPARASELKSEAIRAGWTIEQLQHRLVKLMRDDLQLAQLRASRPKSPTIRGSHGD